MGTCHSRAKRHREHSCGRKKVSARPFVVSLLVLGAVLAAGSCVFAACTVCTGTGSIDRNDGNTNFQNGSTLQAGFAVSISGMHPATTVTVHGTATFRYACSGVPGTLTVDLAGTYAIPAGDGQPALEFSIDMCTSLPVRIAGTGGAGLFPGSPDGFSWEAAFKY